MIVELLAVSTKALAWEKKCDEAYRPKFTEDQNSKPKRAPFFNPSPKVRAPAQRMTVAMRKPMVRAETAMAQPTNWSVGRPSCRRNSYDCGGCDRKKPLRNRKWAATCNSRFATVAARPEINNRLFMDEHLPTGATATPATIECRSE
jgi:hypothetical protein